MSQLLAMSSGVWDEILCSLNGTAVDAPAWQAPFCMSARAVNYSTVWGQVAGETPATWQLADWALAAPLATRPGEAFAYSSSAYWIASYIIEKASFRVRLHG